MKSKISAMMDGELPDAELAGPLGALREEGEAVEAWRRYHLISDALRDTPVLSSGFSARFAARLEQEPTILAPAAAPPRVRPGIPRHSFAVAAGLSAVALVGVAAFNMTGNSDVQVARAPAQPPATQAEIAVVAAPREADDYLRAHQNYSPRNNLQGVAPYVRTVSDSARTR
jgi:sigma-E factor negative regulatory protein RseA